MLKVNLEKTLIKQNKKIDTPIELLAIKEYDSLGQELTANLQKIFPNSGALSGALHKSRKEKSQSVLKKFKQQNRIFHISQIESLCNKYLLKFLPTNYYSGSIDPSAIKAITEFELTEGVKLTSDKCKIMAPTSSFKLEIKPKDPLLFYSIGDDYYYLICKWGNDLNLMRRAWAPIRKILTFKLLIPIMFYAACVSIYFKFIYEGFAYFEKNYYHPTGAIIGEVFITCLISSFVFALLIWLNSAIKDEDEPCFRFFKNHEYSNEYR